VNAEGGLPRAVLDTNVIYSRVLHDLIGRIANDGFLEVVWSEELLAEAKKVLIENKPVEEAVAERWVNYMRAAFPDGEVDIAALQDGLDLSHFTKDPADEHVCALALAANAAYLFTFDDGFYSPALSEYSISVESPDEFLTSTLAENPRAIGRLVEAQADDWGGRQVDDLLDALERAKVPNFVARAREELVD
jgi:predicted nucleic acid-binding protein